MGGAGASLFLVLVVWTLDGSSLEELTLSGNSLLDIMFREVLDLIVSVFFLREKKPNMLVCLLMFSLDFPLLDELVDLMLRSSSDLERLFKEIWSSSCSGTLAVLLLLLLA